ncbi:MAG: insulinase family protein [Ignavibacteriales bacterium]|jgi:predicted Zn-dependent peptidase|nr:pitrilysin family protein [Ignavibacteriaceae bacterium]NLH62129.1 insulinase family protein [Ignavibacteriales bacterium]HOJ17829.1 pitrilysin family protein [Ignavibacteriaceae bacterium]HPO55024.1 pitrilysin family protein [Ignavibacteriaceae bacterium]
MLQNINITNTENGVRVISEYLPYVKSFSLGFWFRNGSRVENKSNNGISHFLEHMVFKGTHKRSSRRIAEEIESVGGYLNAFTSKENTCFYGRGLAQHFGRTFSVLADILQDPLFRENDIKKEAGVVIDELYDIRDNPDDLIFDVFEEKLFKGRGLGNSIIGKEENIRNFNSERLHNYFNNNYKNGDLVIVASGLVEHDKLVSLTERYFNKRKITTISNKSYKNYIAKTEFMLNKEIQQVHCILGKQGYGYKSEKRIPQLLLSNLLGEGSSSRLFQAVREKSGITYQIHTFVNTFSDISSLGIYFSTSESYFDKVLEVIKRETDKLICKEIKEKELNRVKEFAKGTLVMSLEGTTNRMIRMGSSILNHRRIIPPEEVIKRIDSVRIQDIKELAEEHLEYSKLSKIVISSNKRSNKKVA